MYCGQCRDLLRFAQATGFCEVEPGAVQHMGGPQPAAATVTDNFDIKAIIAIKSIAYYVKDTRALATICLKTLF